MASKFTEFLQTNKIDPRRVASASQAIAAAGGEAPPKPRSGRPVTPQLLSRALGGKPVTGPGKTRLLRAVNRVLEQKKKEPVDLRALF